MRFDVPVVGLRTVEVMQAVERHRPGHRRRRTLLFDREKLIEAANDAGIAIEATVPVDALTGRGRSRRQQCWVGTEAS